MAELYEKGKIVGGGEMNLEEVVARHVVTQDALSTKAGSVERKASAVLAASRYSGDAKIRGAHGDIDYYVVLDDTDGLSAALTIEYGRTGHTLYKKGPRKGEPVPAANAVAPLRLAMGMSATTAGTNRVKAKTTSKVAAKRLAKRKRTGA